MIIAKLLLAITIFLIGLSLFFFGPEHGRDALIIAGWRVEPSWFLRWVSSEHGRDALIIAGLELDSGTATALSLICMVSGVILTLRFFFDWRSEDRPG